MSRLLLFENNPRTLRIVQRCLQPMGYTLVPIADKERIKLELRAHVPALILASAEMSGGSGLDVIRDLYGECAEPVPVIPYSGKLTLTALKEVAPVELNVASFLSTPFDPGELVQTVVGIAPPPDAVAASKIVTDLRAEFEQHGLRLEPPAGSSDLAETPFARLLWAIDHNSWTGRLSLDGESSDAVDWYFVMGQFTHAESRGDRDLVDTAVAEGRVDRKMLPNVALKNEEEQLGLLMAYRAIGMHESEGLKKRTTERLLMRGLLAVSGTVVAEEGEWRDSDLGDPSSLPRLVMKMTSDHVKELGGRAIQAHPDSVAVIRLPPARVIRGWGLESEDGRVLELIEKARNREITLDQLMRVASEGQNEDRPRVRALMRLLWTIGYLDFRGRPWDGETSEKIEGLVRVLHRANRSNYFEVLGLGLAAAEKEIKARNRDLARKYHPDTMFEEHPRVQRVAEAIYARVQEAYSGLSKKSDRDALRQELQERKRSGVGSASGGQPEPEKAAVAVKQGELYLRNKAFDEAEVFFRDATLLDPDNADAFVLLGWTRFLKDPSSSSGATKTIEAAIKLNSKHPDAWYYLGRIALLKKDSERARSRFKKALDCNPKHVAAARELRLLERRLGENERRREPRQALRGLFGRRKDD
ncbi:MAG: DnaJ domain-containing protein [Deltaproteobacteria bacterium]|nr:DnaJ domain-containing protein [Deltaproteobacteria bacterium]